MTIDSITLKLFGTKSTVYRAIENGEVVRVFDNREEAEAWIAAQ